jgi:ketosteroid isomerase-like protein
MKKIVIKGAFLLFCVSTFIACNTKSEKSGVSAIDVDQIKKEIQAKEDEFAAVYNAGEMKTIGYYADDAVTFSQNYAPLVGKTAIIEYLKANLDSMSNSRKISFTTNEVFVSNDGEQVVEVGSYKVVDGESNIVDTGNYMTLFVKRDGKYVSLRDMSVSAMPVE